MAERHVLVRTATDFGPPPMVKLIEVTLRFGEERVDFFLDGPNPNFRISRDAAESPTIQYQYRAYLDRWFGRPSFDSPLRTTDSSLIVIDPRELYQIILVSVFASFNQDRYLGAFVDLKAEGPNGEWSETKSLTFLEKAPLMQTDFVFDEGMQVTLQQRTKYVTRDGKLIELPWEPLDRGVLVVGNPVSVPQDAPVG